MKRHFANFVRRSQHFNRRYVASNFSPACVREGDVAHNYVVTRVSSFPKLFVTAIELEHTKTKSKHLHLARDDSNNVFNVLLRTTPMDDTGVAHILEHIVLTGSQKYPVRDPFFKMLDRSMATFMNAMTGSDYTLYPFSTQNVKDFKNLMSVYLDAVFFPNIEKSSFLQEGWRLEHEAVHDKTTPIILKGVVFNEMKGMLADQDYLFGTTMQQSLLPDHTYGCCSGGDPMSIPNLSWDGLKQFHATHYHPSNASFYTYGNMDLYSHLEQIDQQVMQKFSPIFPETDVPAQKRWSESRSVHITCLPDNMAADQDKQTSASASFLLCDIANTYEYFALSILCNLISDGPTSPFYKSLIESGIGSSYSPVTGFHGHQKECIFSIGLQGIHKNDITKVGAIIGDTIDKVVNDGFSQERIESLLHQFELQQKHQKSSFGLHLSFNLLPLWQHGADPMQLLNVDMHIDQLRKDLKNDPKFFQKLCDKYFRKNNHKLTLSMSADINHSASLDQKEQKIVQEKLSQLTEKDLENVFLQGQELTMLQNKKEDLSCLPTLFVSDIPRESPQRSQCNLYSVTDNVKVGIHEQPTNGVTYVSLVRTVNNLPEDLKPLLPLFCSVLTKMGTHETNYQDFAQMEDLYTGGLSSTATISPSPSQLYNTEYKVIFSSHCLDKNVDRMLKLWKELINQPYFGNKDRLQTLIRQIAQDLSSSVPYSGHLYAMSSASEGLSPSMNQREAWEGLNQVLRMQSLVQEDHISHIINQLEQIAQYVLSDDVPNGENIRCSLHSMPENTLNVISSMSTFLPQIIKSTDAAWGECKSESSLLNLHCDSGFTPTTSKKVLHELPLPVNFASMGIPVPVTYTHGHSAPLRILARILSTKYLLREVREKGGAYGTGATFLFDGVFRLYSYRDPRSLDTIKSFEDAITWACDGGFSTEDLNESKLAVFQKVDAPVSPCNRGNAQFHDGISHEMQQKHREILLDATLDDVVSVARKYLLGAASNLSVLGPENASIKQNSDWKISSVQ